MRGPIEYSPSFERPPKDVSDMKRLCCESVMKNGEKLSVIVEASDSGDITKSVNMPEVLETTEDPNEGQGVNSIEF